ncbi:hypothetical protein QBC33DRAFT_216032 [Phialemonium atrogriseum]|uniref:Uncharacterized protein n=1 Tax=Phialemonium atrogriseum TaxID=1093897 RepID=A0AAJ0C6C2_9PEZI|nr:uncharacterized protein QBC33DRAFT_216032 [Phialemonium atrogriseum]KAK1770776.1 hypothetical protein QBC33DRAFT_216032 [Phialemonium atrogriseum]
MIRSGEMTWTLELLPLTMGSTQLVAFVGQPPLFHKGCVVYCIWENWFCFILFVFFPTFTWLRFDLQLDLMSIHPTICLWLHATPNTPLGANLEGMPVIPFFQSFLPLVASTSFWTLFLGDGLGSESRWRLFLFDGKEYHASQGIGAGEIAKARC